MATKILKEIWLDAKGAEFDSEEMAVRSDTLRDLQESLEKYYGSSIISLEDMAWYINEFYISRQDYNSAISKAETRILELENFNKESKVNVGKTRIVLASGTVLNGLIAQVLGDGFRRINYPPSVGVPPYQESDFDFRSRAFDEMQNRGIILND